MKGREGERGILLFYINYLRGVIYRVAEFGGIGYICYCG